MPRSSQWSLPFGPPNQNPVNISPLTHACHMSRPPQPPCFNHSNNIRWRIQAVKFIMETNTSAATYHSEQVSQNLTENEPRFDVCWVTNGDHNDALTLILHVWRN
jgi:hypothetical protein